MRKEVRGKRKEERGEIKDDERFKIINKELNN